MIKNILFDFDGTIADTSRGIVETLRQSLTRLHKPVPSDDTMRATIGLPLRTAFVHLGCADRDEADQAVTVYRQLFLQYEIPNIGIFPEVASTLSKLHDDGMRMAIVTSRDVESLEMILGNNGIDSFFETHVTNSDHLTPKPAPDMVLALLKRMGITADETLVVGDTTFDIDMGNSAKCRTCAVTYGNHPLATLLTSHPTFTADRFSEILSIARQG